MPPRLPLPSSVELITHTTSPLELALRTCQAFSSRSFSTSSPRAGRLPAVRWRFYKWQKRLGKELKKHEAAGTNYMRGAEHAGRLAMATPYPSNPYFYSEPVLSEQSRELIHQRVSANEEPIMVVSADFGVDHRRVAAVVRMKEIEKEWESTGKKLARPYAKAVMSMLPLHHVDEATTVDSEEMRPFEPINEIYVHGLTMQQLFVPASESRHFTRADAAAAFHERMLPADARIPHKELVKHLRRVKDGQDEGHSRQEFVEGAREAERADVLRDADKSEWEKRLTVSVPTERAEFRFKKMAVDDGGWDGRSRRGVGWRYGAPYEDRKKDQVKHPTKYE